MKRRGLMEFSRSHREPEALPDQLMKFIASVILVCLLFNTILEIGFFIIFPSAAFLPCLFGRDLRRSTSFLNCSN